MDSVADCNISLSLSPQILSYERVASVELRRTKAKDIYDRYFFSEMLAMSHVSYICSHQHVCVLGM